MIVMMTMTTMPWMFWETAQRKVTEGQRKGLKTSRISLNSSVPCRK